jgi:hypothetical protein
MSARSGLTPGRFATYQTSGGGRVAAADVVGGTSPFAAYRPHRADRIDLVTEFLHPAYEVECEGSSDAGETGLLTLFRLKSGDSLLPGFAGRWDLKENAVDIDLCGDKVRSNLFKEGKIDIGAITVEP